MTDERTTCPHCEKPWDQHNLKQALDCIYTGTPLKDGASWDEATSIDVAGRIVRRLEGET